MAEAFGKMDNAYAAVISDATVKSRNAFASAVGHAEKVVNEYLKVLSAAEQS